ncbi:MAG TPA: sugar ABC transporter substrate-binding protein [Hyphomicrobiales bacterium]|nr:sugar ABC transporter substrate-binding protein [Hyphomicrobiales bacterium]
MLKRMLAAGLLLGALALPFHVAQAADHHEGKRVALFLGPTDDVYLGAINKYFTSEAGTLGMKVTTFSSPFDPALQAQQIDDAIAQKYDLLAIQILSQKAIVPPLLRAKAAHIPVVLIAAPFTDNSHDQLYETYVGTDNTIAGTLAGQAIVNALEASHRKTAKIGVLAGAMAEGNAPTRAAAIKAVMAKHPNYKIVALEDTQWDPVKAERAAGQLIARFSGQGGLDAFYGMSDTIANAAVQAAKSAGVKLGENGLVIVGGSCQKPGIQDIRAGTMVATVLVAPSIEGKMGADAVAKVFDGVKQPKRQHGPHEIVDTATLSKYADLCTF